jgi:hypothetical protein
MEKHINHTLYINKELSDRLRKYTYVGSFSNGIAFVIRSGKWGAINKEGAEIIPCEYQHIDAHADWPSLITVVSDGKYGLYNVGGKRLVPCIYNAVHYEKDFVELNSKGEGRYIVLPDHSLKPYTYRKYNYDNSSSFDDDDINETFFNPDFQNRGMSFSEGLLAVKWNDKCGYINTQFEPAIPNVYDAARAFSCGLAYVEQEEKQFFIDRKGVFVFACDSYEVVSPFKEGISVVRKDGKYGAIDTTGTLIIPCIYDYLRNFSQGLAAADKHGGFGFIDTRGDVVIPMEYNRVGDFTHEGIAWVSSVEGLGCVNKQGKLIVPCIHTLQTFSLTCDDIDADIIEGELLRVRLQYEGLIRLNGDIVVPCIYDHIYPFGLSELGLMRVERRKKQGLINKQGQIVVPLKYDFIDEFIELRAKVKRGGKWGFIDNTGREVIPCVYDTAEDFSEDFAVVGRDGKFGYVDSEGNEVVECRYEEAGSVEEGIGVVREEGKWMVREITN